MKTLKKRFAIVLAVMMIMAQFSLLAVPAIADEAPAVNYTAKSASLMSDAFQFTLPEADAANMLVAPLELSGNWADLADDTARMKVVDSSQGIVWTDETAYIAYKLKNNGTNVISVQQVKTLPLWY